MGHHIIFFNDGYLKHTDSKRWMSHDPTSSLEKSVKALAMVLAIFFDNGMLTLSSSIWTAHAVWSLDLVFSLISGLNSLRAVQQGLTAQTQSAAALCRGVLYVCLLLFFVFAVFIEAEICASSAKWKERERKYHRKERRSFSHLP